MLYVLPDYYLKFHCIADQCEDTCCAGWQIMIDKQSLRRYKACQSPYRRRLFRSVNWRKQCFRQDGEKRCSFLDEQNLCELYRTLGPESLCRTCRLYPRHIEEYENVREISLSVSCPEAARLLLSRQRPLSFREFYREREEQYPQFDELFYGQLVEGRRVMLEVFQNRSLSLARRCYLVSVLADKMQDYYQQGKLFDWPVLWEQALVESKEDRMSQDPSPEFSAVPEAKKSMEKNGSQGGWRADQSVRCYQWIRGMVNSLGGFEALKEDWPLWLKETRDWLYQRGYGDYRKICRDFSRWLDDHWPDWEISFEQLQVYFLFIYFCGAVYDEEILASAQLGIVHGWLIYEMLMAVWLRNGKEVSLEDLMELVHRYSRELEHSDVNQRKMEQLMQKKKLPWL